MNLHETLQQHVPFKTKIPVHLSSTTQLYLTTLKNKSCINAK